jgi:hypothetical protein
MLAYGYGAGNVQPNSTVSGGNLYYVSSFSGSNALDWNWSGTNRSGDAKPQINIGRMGFNWNGNVGTQPLYNSTALSGTWRALTTTSSFTNVGYCGCAGVTSMYAYFGLFVRVS